MTRDEAIHAVQNPGTTALQLAEIAGQYPELRPHVALHHAAYPDLLAWLGALGDPAVDDALRRRQEELAAPPPVPQGTGPVPVTPAGATPYPGPPATTGPIAYATQYGEPSPDGVAPATTSAPSRRTAVIIAVVVGALVLATGGFFAVKSILGGGKSASGIVQNYSKQPTQGWRITARDIAPDLRDASIIAMSGTGKNGVALLREYVSDSGNSTIYAAGLNLDSGEPTWDAEELARFSEDNGSCQIVATRILCDEQVSNSERAYTSFDASTGRQVANARARWAIIDESGTLLSLTIEGSRSGGPEFVLSHDGKVAWTQQLKVSRDLERVIDLPEYSISGWRSTSGIAVLNIWGSVDETSVDRMLALSLADGTVIREFPYDGSSYSVTGDRLLVSGTSGRYELFDHKGNSLGQVRTDSDSRAYLYENGQILATSPTAVELFNTKNLDSPAWSFRPRFDDIGDAKPALPGTVIASGSLNDRTEYVLLTESDGTEITSGIGYWNGLKDSKRLFLLDEGRVTAVTKSGEEAWRLTIGDSESLISAGKYLVLADADRGEYTQLIP